MGYFIPYTPAPVGKNVCVKRRLASFKGTLRNINHSQPMARTFLLHQGSAKKQFMVATGSLSS
jgi:hypothetical protein